MSEVVCGVLFWFGGLVYFAPLFYAPGVFFFSFVSASSFDWHGADYALAVVHTLVLVGMSVSVCRDASLQFHAELWELMVIQWLTLVRPVARTECWITRVARETFPASAIRHGRSVGPAVLPGRLYSSPCNQTRTERARGIAHPLASDFRGEGEVAREILDQPCLQRDCVPRI